MQPCNSLSGFQPAKEVQLSSLASLVETAFAKQQGTAPFRIPPAIVKRKRDRHLDAHKYF